MKVFLSHSSKDKWAARQIARQVEELGASVFLDEKDIRTGDSIDSAIRSHLEESDHFLLLLSPASIKSEWVLIELGGALALGKTVVPVLMYVGANELPQAISLTLARDINEIGNYFEELQASIKHRSHHIPARRWDSSKRKKSKATRASNLVARAPFRVGSSVTIVTDQPQTVYRQTGGLTWAAAMDRYMGLKGIVRSVDKDGDVRLDLDEGQWFWAYEWLASTKAT